MLHSLNPSWFCEIEGKKCLEKEIGIFIFGKNCEALLSQCVNGCMCECSSWLWIEQKSYLNKSTLTSNNQHLSPEVNMMLPNQYIYAHRIGWRQVEDAMSTRRFDVSVEPLSISSSTSRSISMEHN